jgi:hypothetical protein
MEEDAVLTISSYETQYRPVSLLEIDYDPAYYSGMTKATESQVHELVTIIFKTKEIMFP